MRFHALRVAERSHFQPKIAAIEQSAIYPLGNDFFQIDHGADYFAFFDRLGEVSYQLAIDCERVAAVGAGVLRQIPYYRGEAPRLAWYLCDLKVHPSYQQRQLSIRLLQHAIAAHVLRCAQGYAISMNPSDSSHSSRSSNRLVRVLERFRWLKFQCVTTLGIYSLNADDMRRLEPILIQHRGSIAYLSLVGKKDLRLCSNGQVLPLLHVQWGIGAASGIEAPQAGYRHMFCAPVGDALAITLTQQGITPDATASVISTGMQSDWCFILTSDI